MSAPGVGLLGVGHLGEYLVRRLARVYRGQIVLAPRNRERAERLADEFKNVRVVRDNAATVQQSDVVLLATRPAQAATAIAGLPWHPGHTLVSLCAGVARDALLLNAGAASLCRAMPITAALIGESPTCVYPNPGAARSVLEAFGPLHQLESEAQFEAAAVSAAYYGWVHGLIHEIARWTAEAGLPAASARALVAQTTRAAAGMVMSQPEKSLPQLLDELCTPGGITELGFGVLEDREALEAWRKAAQVVLERLRTPVHERSSVDPGIAPKR